MELEQAKQLVLKFARNQVLLTKQANSRRGITKAAVKEEATLVGLLIEGLSDTKLTKEEVADFVATLS